ncbi:MAG: ABC-F family ATP-binding cassette domain-containing protein [Rhodothermales bacterium]|nr:ABC-F family ATP-binding cassette domain-containing protein [Rhodothermales bacterium]
MIQLQNIALAFGGQPVLEGLSWTVKPGRRIGLIGPNGAGKSTLLKIIAGRLAPDDGTVAMPGGTTVGYLAQDVQEAASGRSVVEEAMTAFEQTLALQAEEHRLTAALEAEADHTTDAYEKLLHALERVQAALVTQEAHLIRPKTEAVLTGLGFEPDDLDRPLHTFSGGWRMRVALARILLTQPDFLLLDEPTNHLDIVSIDWLEGYLRSYPGTVVLVSHDRYFLDRMITTTAELANGRVTEYAGNYSFYLEEREARRALQRSAYENQQRQIAETERFIERFRYKATKARQVQSRVKMLEKLDRIPPPPTDEAEIHIRFPAPRRSGRTVLELTTFSKTYATEDGAIDVFEKAGPLLIERGDKIALIGKNGAGKSTLARMLRGTEPFEGDRELGYHVDLTFFAQHQADTLEPSATILESLQQVARGQTETELRTLLGAFLFTGDDVFKRVGVLSGGEKSRVALARTLLHPANFLILDEPTNHLDIQSINVLVEALRQYAGTFVVVSHDRHFLDQIVNKVWVAGGGQVRVFQGTYSEYRWQVEHGTAATLGGDGLHADDAPERAEPEQTPEAPARSGGPKTKEQKRREAEERNRLYRAMQNGGGGDYEALTEHQLRTLYEQVEAQILEKEEEKATLEATLGDPALYEDPDRARATTAAYDALRADLAALYERWEALAEQLAA